MVKKVTRKKSTSKRKIVKKSTSSAKRRVSSSNNKSLSRNDFETFKFGVQRLKELERELNSLDTRGFANDVQKIRPKLKTVSEIPNIEKSLKILRLKIQKKYRPRRRNSKIKEIHEDIEDVKKDLRSIKKNRKDSFEDLQNEIKKLRKINKNNFPIDSGVDALVDINFNSFLSSVKKVLSERVRNRESEIDSVLRDDLEKRESKYKRKQEVLLRNFENHKKKLEDEYKKKYKLKLESTLHKEIADKFNKKLQERLDKEKVDLTKTYKKTLRDEADIELQKRKFVLERKLKEEFTDKLKALRDEYHNKIVEENKKEEKELNMIEQKKIKLEGDKQNFESQKKIEMERIRENISKELHGKLEKEMQKKESVLRSKLAKEYDLRLKKQLQDHEAELKKKKIDLELEMQKKIKQVLS